MALKGKSVHTSIPYIPESERSSDTPTIFWLFPKNMKATYDSLELFSKGANISGKGQKSINPQKMAEADSKDMLSFCEKVQNYQFGEDFSELAAKGVIPEITDDGTLRLMYADMDPIIFQEIQNASADWERLDAGKEAYEIYLEFKRSKAKK
jgi:hypothetical protein